MNCPFPGMDPYIEQPTLWPDFHDSLIAYIREELQPLLRPKYAALSQDRLFVVEHERPIWPDVSVIETDPWPGGGRTAAAVLVAPDEPLVVEFEAEEFRQPVLHIVEPAAGNRIVTAIEVLSPDHKASGPGRDSYLHKCDELWSAGTHLVEIDLLRDGQRTARPSLKRVSNEPPWSYLVAVSRWPKRGEFYRMGLRQRLQRIAIPLAHDDPDVVLDLQAALTRCWQSGPYPTLLGYHADPPGQLSADDLAWCRQTVAIASPSR